ncbi:MAG TPA: cell division protein ZapA [Acetobacteraceae bacterium]|nr:cell division protein ZapA [Acetobacteraceae bacterium]
MAQVTVRINGFAYSVGCQDGEEQHLTAMAAEIERRIDSIKAAAGQSGEARMLVMAALLMADDIFELTKALREAEKRAASTEAAAPPSTDPKMARKINRLARRAEDIAAGLERN